MNKEPFQIFRLVAVVLVLAGLSMAVFAAKPASVTIAQLDRQEGHDPAQIAQGIPRDFPLPAGSHDLVANSTLSIGSVKGVDAETAEQFYRDYFKRAAWDVVKQAKAPGFIMLTACQKSGAQCVKLSASSPGGMGGTPNLMRFTFPTKSELKR